MGIPQFFGHLSLPGIDPLWEDVPNSVKDELLEFIEEGGAELGERCFWYDVQTKRCKHHKYRPQICRDFEIGNPHCIRLRIDHGIK